MIQKSSHNIWYKSTEDPLYRADKLIGRATPPMDPDNLDASLDVMMENYIEKANMTAMTYTSSWGEANPNCGKEVTDKLFSSQTRDFALMSTSTVQV